METAIHVREIRKDNPTLRKIWFEADGVKMMAIYHPSALLRDPSKRPEAFMDLRELRKEIRERCPNTDIRYDSL